MVIGHFARDVVNTALGWTSSSINPANIFSRLKCLINECLLVSQTPRRFLKVKLCAIASLLEAESLAKCGELVSKLISLRQLQPPSKSPTASIIPIDLHRPQKSTCRPLGALRALQPMILAPTIPSLPNRVARGRVRRPGAHPAPSEGGRLRARRI